MCKGFLDFDVYNFPDDTTPYVCGKNLSEEYSITIIKSFENNYMKMDPGKCYLFISERKFEHLWAKVNSNVEN